MVSNIIIFADIYDEYPDLDPGLKQEWESEDSIKYISNTLINAGYKTYIIRSGNDFLKIASTINLSNKSEWLFFNLVEGFLSRNREGYIPAMAEYLGIAHAGSDAYSQMISMDKSLTLKIASALGIPIPGSKLIENTDELKLLKLIYPIFVKPNGEGSSIGISDKNIINNYEELISASSKIIEMHGSVIIEKYLPGAEYTVGIFGNKGNYKATRAGRVHYPGNVYSSEIKSKETMFESLEFSVPNYKEEIIKKYSALISARLEISGYARADWKEDENGNPKFLEINLTPGLSYRYSSLPVCYLNTFGSYESMIMEIIKYAEEEYTHNKRFKYGNR